MPADRNLNTLMLTYLQSRYSVTNGDLATLIARYVVENPDALLDVTKIRKALEVAALA